MCELEAGRDALLDSLEAQAPKSLDSLAPEECLQDVWEVKTVVSSWVLDIEVSVMREQLGSWDKRFLR